MTEAITNNPLNLRFLNLLSPAETLIVMNGVEADFDLLIQVTFMDLLLKKVLAITVEERQPSSQDPIQTYKYIGVGEFYKGYTPLLHENMYTDEFGDDWYKRILLRTFVKDGYDSVNSSGLYRSQIVKNKSLQPYYHQNIIQRLNGHFDINDAGLLFQAQVKSEFQTAVNYLQSNEGTSETKAALAKQMGGNIFLVKDFEFGVIQDFSQELMIAIEQSKTTFTDSIIGFKGWGNSINMGISW